VKQITGKELAKAIQRRGWQLSRVKGSHHIFLLHALMKIADLEED